MKKLLAIVISMAMIVAMMPVGVFADTAENCTAENCSHQAAIGTTHYDTLQEAIDAAVENSTIKLINNVTVTGKTTTIEENKKLTIDLNGHILSGTNTSVNQQALLIKGNVIVKDSIGSGKICSGYTGISGRVVSVEGNGGLTIEAGTIITSEGMAKAGSTIYIGGNGKAIMNGGKVIATALRGNFAVNIKSSNAAFEMNGGEITAVSADNEPYITAICGSSMSTITIKNGEISGPTAVSAKGSNIEILGGKFNGEVSTKKNAIRGGTFSGDVRAYIADGYVLTDGTVVKNTNSADAVASIDEQYFKTLAGAIAAASDRATVKLIKDIKEDITVPAGKSITIDLNSKSITNSSSDTITVAQGANLTIKGTGTVDNITHGKAALVNYGTAVLDGGTYTRSLEDEENNKDSAGKNSFYTILNDKGGNMTIKNGVNVTNKGHFSSMIRNGGDSASQSASKLKINGGSFSGGINTVKNDELGELTVSGGFFSNTSQFVIMNWHKANLSGGSFEANDSAEAVLFTSKYLENRAVGELTVTGGTYISKDNQKVLCDRYNNSEEYKGTATITGGTFSTSPKAYVAGENNKVYKYNDSNYLVAASAPSGYNWAAATTDEQKSEYDFIGTKIYTGGGTPATDNVTNNTTDKSTTADLAPAVKDNKAETTVDAKTADKIVDKAVANKSTEVIVDAAGNNTVASSEVAIPEKTVKELAEKTDANLVIKTDNGKVDLDRTALAAVAEQAGTDGTVKLAVETVKTDENICHVDLKLITSNGAVKDFRGGNVKVTINLDKELAAKELVCVYIDDNGSYTLVEGVLNADGTYTFTTGHFSEYAVMAKGEADKKIAEQLDTMIKDVNLKVRTSKTAKKNIKAVVSGDITALTDAGYTVKYKFYRSEKKASKYVSKGEKTADTYINTAGKKGTKYYYKAKAMVYSGDTLVGQTVLKQCKYGVRTWSK